MRLFRLFVALAVLVVSTGATAADRPVLWGMGAHPCTDYLQAYAKRDAPQDPGAAEYLGFRDWLGGFVSGLSLATGEDVIRGLELDVAMDRIAVQCEERPAADFFNAAADLIRALSVLR
ncbi:MAG: hypothetical protein PVF91_03190 [Chromatiales bacterium]|jgi:hypothetical protein